MMFDHFALNLRNVDKKSPFLNRNTKKGKALICFPFMMSLINTFNAEFTFVLRFLCLYLLI